MISTIDAVSAAINSVGGNADKAIGAALQVLARRMDWIIARLDVIETRLDEPGVSRLVADPIGKENEK